MSACTHRTRPSAFTGDTGAVCGRESLFYCRLDSGEWVERCERHAHLKDVVERIGKRGSGA